MLKLFCLLAWAVEVTSTPTRPVDNVVITMKDLQDRNNNYLMQGRWKIKVNYFYTKIIAKNQLLTNPLSMLGWHGYGI